MRALTEEYLKEIVKLGIEYQLYFGEKEETKINNITDQVIIFIKQALNQEFIIINEFKKKNNP